MMDHRSDYVLRGVVHEYIETAQPVGSARLREKLRLALSPATVRNILRGLECEGYIYQPHTSSGRIPTDRGYRYYVDCLSVQNPQVGYLRKLAHEYEGYAHTYERPARASAKFLSELAGSLAVSGWMSQRDIHEAGFALLVDEHMHEDALRELSDILDNIDRYIEQYAEDTNKRVVVYIGEENPAFEASHTSMVVQSTTLKDGEKVVLLLVGPKRMPYVQHISLVRNVISVINHYS